MIRVSIDGRELSPEDYVIDSGVVTIHASALPSSLGMHRISVQGEWIDGEALNASCDLNALVSNAEVLALFRSIEWMHEPDEGAECPICSGLRPDHEPDCRLARVIARLSSQEP